MIIVKLGGSLFGTPELSSWMQTLVNYSKQVPIVIVPGGGPFADQVRLADSHYKLSDKAAHHMALLAMKQFGLLLADIQPNAQLIETNSRVRSSFSIWLPDDSLLQQSSLDHCWSVTSDTIALWLASKLTAKTLLLIKRAQTDTVSIASLMQEQIIDPAFSDIFAHNKVDTKILHYKSSNNFDSFSQQPSLSLP
ncbi:MAG: delta 1-pyrroline-5-carboxylate synthetase [Methylophaga sp.]|nr:MAG: delta 1-pyrroline-5-carboxylate synthetase [Methylophaga sp.]